MACNTLANRYEPCKEFAGGLRGVFLVPYAFGDVVSKDASGLVLSINNGASPTPVKSTAYFFELKGLSTLEISGATSRDNGTTAYTQTLTLSLKPSGSTPNQADSDAELFDTLTKGRWRVITWDRNNVFTLLGAVEGLDATTDVEAWGTQMGDARLNTVTLIGMETLPKVIVDAESYADMSTVVTISAS
jgi:hypothetical protein